MQRNADNCPLCHAERTVPFARAQGRDYLHCHVCDLAFVPLAQHPSPLQARSRYELHNNDPTDAGYRDFLNRLARVLIPRLAPGAKGLDYGSGPGPTLSRMLIEKGFEMSIYDPFFAPDSAVLNRHYDFVTCTETVEHFSHPATEFACFDRLLRHHGHLGIMTQIRDPESVFTDWWYLRDETHVSFYSLRTFAWIGAHWQWRMSTPSPTIVIYEKTSQLR